MTRVNAWLAESPGWEYSYQTVKVVEESHDEEIVSILQHHGIRFVEMSHLFRQDLKAVC